jgi:pimeloyl-[acyl-carrier protein] methyl ester esterase
MQQLVTRLDGAAVLVGWSLGGLLAQFMAMQYPGAVSKLILLNSTPSFRRRADWPFALDDALLTRFATDLSDDTRGTLLRFLALQFLGTPHEKDDLRQARKLLLARPVPGRETLQQGLQLLRDCDLRAQLTRIQVPVLSIAGEHDRLVPTSASVYLAEQVGNGRAQIIRGAGHAPFLTHTMTVSRLLESFIHEY